MSEMKPLTILLAEDNMDHADLMVDTLEAFNAKNTVIHACDGEQAIEYLAQHFSEQGNTPAKPDLILLDINMPRMNGLETLTIIKNNPQWRHIPVVMISTSNTDQEIRRCFEQGASSYIAKPMRFEEFSSKIKALNLYWVLTSELPTA